AVFALEMHADTVPQSVVVADYNPDQAWERYKAEANIARKDPTTYGQPYVYGTHHLDQDGAKWEAQLRHEAQIAWQVVYEGESNVLDLRPARVLRMDEAVPEAPNGQLIVEITHSGARDEAYHNSYKAIPCDRRFRLKLEEDAWPRISGTLSARVTSPSKYEYAYLTQQGHYTVRFDLDFDEWNPGGESVPLRLAKPFAGRLQTGFHFPALDGDEAVIEFRDGNPDKPYISQFHHHSQATDLITNQDRWLSRNVIRTQSNNKLRMEDWRGYESIKLSTEHSGKSQLNLGYLVDAKKQRRGEGFELRTSGWGAIRGGKGLFISADDQPNAAGPQLDMQAALRELQSALSRVTALVDATMQARATPPDKTAQAEVMRALDQLASAGILASAPGGIALTTPRSVQHAAGENVMLTAGRHADVSALKRLTLTAGELISLCAHKLGLKLFAARGKIEIQAQSDALDLFAEKQLRVASAGEDVVVVGKTKAVMASGGAALTIENGNVVFHCPGEFRIKAARFVFEGPESMNPPLPALPKSALKLADLYPSSH
uniref:DUF2345 domain-containing protein n=1 Tax=Burkholderia sp. WSM2230 TaxID=944435 RepID=UPI0004722788